MKDLLDLILTPTVVTAIAGAIIATGRYFFVKNNEYKSINRALLSEISRLLGVLPRHRDWWEKCMKDQDTDLPLINFSTDVYNVILTSWAKVDPKYVAHAAGFYGYVLYLNRLQAERTNYPQNKLEKFNVAYLKTLENLITNFNGKFEQAFKKFKVELPNYEKPVASSPSIK